jgi:hypothetical protein
MEASKTLCAISRPQVSRRKKWAQPITIDALGHLTPKLPSSKLGEQHD